MSPVCLALLGPIGAPELLIILVVVVVIFGAGKLAGVGGALGQSIREFRRAASEPDDDGNRPVQPEARSEVQPPATSARPAAPPTVSCPQCSTSNAAGAKFCSECGASLPARVN